ncbi:MAG TPA: hypothetical protein IAB04_07095 [Candidatus Avimonoglobus intestinipullorum]|uniref:Uncharacterized protein n=1 Tax=Candidatus Avimonoglobus intestinipullorum TaxID=2840699 RepID=A0A9D1S6X4_9FIRM|nr:hypothetical protein [Candidatus Avimonoglobus intestinipullorum]
MDRLTTKNSSGQYILSAAGTEQAALQKLAAFENMYDALLAEQDRVLCKIEALRAQNKTKSVTFQQLLAEKLQLATIISRFKLWEIN